VQYQRGRTAEPANSAALVMDHLAGTHVVPDVSPIE
jgi:hypothetical protein